MESVLHWGWLGPILAVVPVYDRCCADGCLACGLSQDSVGSMLHRGG